MPSPGTARALLAALAMVLTVTGCGTASDPSPPTGIDELTVPTPSPDPDDFVDAVDNPWFPLPPGSTWSYQVIGAVDATDLLVTVAPGPVVSGVATTARVSRADGVVATDWYAQDTDGNVWWFGRDGEWRAGEEGAQAGLAMPAHPRVGDGYRTAYAPGTAEDVATVRALDGTVTVPAGTFDGLLVVETTSVLDPQGKRTLYVAEGLGPVEEDDLGRTARLSDATLAD
ncbi:hypothetical protein GON03_06670 [Nocardioides sp. MAH-18]|uniref:Uncharacterized protein n=1 Tax=Nocardioides agri TaxID=2682843 RepID=A0A6L6XP15_9ACTN|nr:MULTISPECIES: hypothetical protein [unclassified Nocardioides]MBA2953997.1 hypothetical protein [Nocardioides sp. CGMCC 1.13656]MVQ48860.1 hypothetical protein [Nocardioides sp. MAH-18]